MSKSSSILELIREARKKLNEIDSILETIEILQNKELIEEIRKAEEEYRKGEYRKFDNVQEAIKWLKSEEE